MLRPTMVRVLAILALLFGLASVHACGFDKKLKVRGEPCTRTHQCMPGLACLGGVCLPSPDAGADGGDGG